MPRRAVYRKLSGAAAGAALLALAMGMPATAQTTAEDWIVAVSLNRQVLSEDLPALVREGRQFLPLAQFASLLLIPVDRVNDSEIEGEIASSGRRFSVDTESGRIGIDGSYEPLPEDDFIRRDDEIYLASDTLARLLGISLAYDPRNLAFTVDSEQPLPVEVRARQERLRERLLAGDTAPAAEPLAYAAPYAPLSAPLGNIDLFAGRDSQGRLSAEYDALFSTEAGFLTTFLFATGDDTTPLRDARFEAGRQSQDGGVFGVDPLTELWGGDVQQPILPLVGGGQLGRGLVVSSMPLDTADSFDATTIEGDADPGWDVELYRNGLLIDFQTVDRGGRYRFENVDLDYGINTIRLAFYGPEGQIREATRRISVGTDMARPGETTFRGYAGQPGQRLLEPLLEHEGTYDESGFSLEVSHGFSRYLSATAFAGRAQTDRAPLSDFALFGGAGARLSLENLALDSNVVFQEGGGLAADISAIADLGGISVSARQALFDDFMSPADTGPGEQLESLSEIRFNTAFVAPLAGAVSLSMEGERLDFTDGRERLSGSAEIRHRVGPVNLSHDLTLRHDSFDVGTSETAVLYAPAASFRWGAFWGRGTARFDLTGDDLLDSAAATVRYRISDDATIGAQVNYSPLTDTTSFGANYSHDLGFATASLIANGDSEGNYAVGLGVSFSFGFDQDHRPFMSSERIATFGAISPFVYFDRNADGDFDEGTDTPLPDVAFAFGSGRVAVETTDVRGQAQLTGLPTTQPVLLAVDHASLPDPFWVSAKGPVEIEPRPARIMPVEFPIVEGGEISGTVRLDGAADGQPVGGLRLVLRTLDGRRIGRTRTLGNGYFLFQAVAPGEYRVEVEAGQEMDGAAIESAGRRAVVAEAGALVEGLDMTVDMTATPAADKGSGQENGR